MGVVKTPYVDRPQIELNVSWVRVPVEYLDLYRFFITLQPYAFDRDNEEVIADFAALFTDRIYQVKSSSANHIECLVADKEIVRQMQDYWLSMDVSCYSQ